MSLKRNLMILLEDEGIDVLVNSDTVCRCIIMSCRQAGERTKSPDKLEDIPATAMLFTTADAPLSLGDIIALKGGGYKVQKVCLAESAKGGVAKIAWLADSRTLN